MNNVQESIDNLKKYFRKLSIVIEKDSSFSLFNKKFINKKRIDDIICCIEASWPDEYKKRKYKDLKIMTLYRILTKKNVCNSSLFSNLYVVNYPEFTKNLNALITEMEKELKALDKE